MPTLIFAKGSKVTNAIVELSLQADGEYNHATITLHKNLDRNHASRVLVVSFQRNRLDTRDLYNAKLKPIEEIERDMPPSEYDLGMAWGRFYGEHIDGSFARSDFEATIWGMKRVRQAANIIDKVNTAISAYNINLLTSDNLKRWVMALEKFGVDVETKVWARGEWMRPWDLSAEQRGITRRYLETRKADEKRRQEDAEREAALQREVDARVAEVAVPANDDPPETIN
jgi:hypothetical protein